MALSTPLPLPLLDLINRELESDETPVWIGQPIPKFFSRTPLSNFLFAIPWTAFSIFWMCGAAGFRIPEFGPQMFFMLFGLPFVLIGLGLLSTPFWERSRMKKTAYVITDHRAIIFSGGFSSTTIRSFEPSELKSTTRHEKANGTGDILFDPDAEEQNSHNRNFSHATVGFFNIPNVREVEKHIRELAKKAKTARKTYEDEDNEE